jgi:PAS domain S-box-containing protein
MKVVPKKSDRGLRGRAVALLGRKARSANLRPPNDNAQRQLHELQVHQIELEIQNEELIAAREQSEAAIARYAELYNFAPVGYFTLGSNGAAVNMNLSGARLLGLERGRLLGKRFGSFLAESDVPKFNAFLRRVFAGESPQSCEVSVVRARQSTRVVFVEGILSADGSECQAVVADITDRKLAQEEVGRLNADLERRVEQRTTTIRRLVIELAMAEKRERVRLSDVLHSDLQQRLIGAIFILESMKGQLSAESQKNTTKVVGILSGSVDLARRLAVELSPPILSSNGLGPGLVWLGKWMGENHGLSVKVIVVDTQASLPEDVSFTLFQSVRELLFNVIKHAKVKSARVTMDNKNRKLRIVVSDEGVGFDPSGKHASVSGRLGIFSVSQRLELLGGHLEIDSAPGEGSRFTLVLPEP